MTHGRGDLSQWNRAAWTLLEAGRLREALQHWSAVAQGLRQAGRIQDAKGVARTMITVTTQGDARLHLVALYTMAETAWEGAELEEAEHWIRRALALHEQLGDRRGAASDLVSLGELAEADGDLEHAVELWNEALGRLDAERSTETVYDVWIHLGRVHAALGRDELAAVCAQRAEQLAARWAA